MKIPTKNGALVTINTNLYNLVRDNKKARERKHNARTVAWVLQKEHPLLAQIPLDKLEQYIKESKTLSRQWRKLLEEKPDFQGTDYHKTKKKTVENVQKSMGYKV